MLHNIFDAATVESVYLYHTDYKYVSSIETPWKALEGTPYTCSPIVSPLVPVDDDRQIRGYPLEEWITSGSGTRV